MQVNPFSWTYLSFAPCLNHSPLTGLYRLVNWSALSRFVRVYHLCLVGLACDFPLPVTPKAYLDLIVSSSHHELFFSTPAIFPLQPMLQILVRSGRHTLFITSFSTSYLVRI